MNITEKGVDRTLSFTSGDRVLLHLLLKSNHLDWTGGIADQDDIAAYCGIGRTHVPRALKPLISDDLVEESQGRAPGRTRRVKVYSLTSKGIEAAVALRDKANETVMEWTDDQGRSEREPCVDALRRINDRLLAGSMNQIPISLFLTIVKDRIGWNEILFLSNSVRSDSSETLYLPEGWKPFTPPAVPDHFIPRDDDLGSLSEMIRTNGVSALVGGKGTGKRTIVSKLSENDDLKVLWLTRDGEEEYSIDPAIDLLVMVGVPIIDIATTLIGGGRTQLKDPRSEEWPEVLRSIPLLGILDGVLTVEGDAIMSLSGLNGPSFMARAVELGLDEDLAREYFRASRGIPEALSYLEDIDPSVVSKMSSLDTEAAVISLMLGLRTRN